MISEAQDRDLDGVRKKFQGLNMSREDNQRLLKDYLKHEVGLSHSDAMKITTRLRNEVVRGRYK